MKLNHIATALIAGSATLTPILADCSPDDNTAAEATESAASTATGAVSEMEKGDAAAQPVDVYIKEKPADKGMTAIFGTLTSNTNENIKVSSFKLERLKEDTRFEQYDIEDGKIFEAPEGLTIPANSELVLKSDSTHFMVMNNDEAMDVGAEYKLVIGFPNGSSITQDAGAYVQPVGEESYGNGGDLNNPEHMGGGETDHSGH